MNNVAEIDSQNDILIFVHNDPIDIEVLILFGTIYLLCMAQGVSSQLSAC